MKILILKDVISGQHGWRREGEIHDLDPKMAKHYIDRGIGVAADEKIKEEKAKVETKEAKAPKKRVTKKAK